MVHFREKIQDVARGEEETSMSNRRSYDQGNLRAYGEGSLRCRGRIWWLYYSLDGVQIPESSRSPKKTVASSLLRVRLGEIAKGVIPAAARKEKVTFETLESLHITHLAQRGSAIGTAKGAWKHMKRFLGDRRVEDLTYEAFEDYWKSNKEKLKPATIRDYLGCLKTAFNLASRKRLVSYVPVFPEIPVANAREVFVRDQDANAVLLALPEYACRFVEAQQMIGWRGKSLRALEWSRNVDWDQELLILQPDQAKNRKAQVLPFSDEDYPELGTLLREQHAYKERVEQELGVEIRWVFFRPLMHAKRVLPIGDLRKQWQKACKAVGLSGERRNPGGITPHDFRRSVARRMDLELGVPRAVAKKVLGHSTDSMYSRYAGIVIDDDVRAAARKLSEGIRMARAKGARVVPLPTIRACHSCGGTERNRHGHCVACKRRRAKEWARRRREERRKRRREVLRGTGSGLLAAAE
jgi:integrase